MAISKADKQGRNQISFVLLCNPQTANIIPHITPPYWKSSLQSHPLHKLIPASLVFFNASANCEALLDSPADDMVLSNNYLLELIF